jgi:hypothetical protein
MEELRLPKRQVEIEVACADGSSRRAKVHLSDFSAHHTGRETVSDLLNAGSAFFPVADSATGAILLLARSNVIHASVSSLEERTLPVEIPSTEHRLRVKLLGGSTLEGTLTHARPPERARAVDALNESGPFLALTAADKTLLINKRFIVSVEDS